MLPIECIPNRRSFLKGGLGVAVGLSTLILTPPAATASNNAWMVGPQPGFSPEIGTLTSMLDFTHLPKREKRLDTAEMASAIARYVSQLTTVIRNKRRKLRKLLTTTIRAG